jgi:hypothetical protein
VLVVFAIMFLKGKGGEDPEVQLGESLGGGRKK